MQDSQNQLTAAQQQRLAGVLREGEQLVYAAPCADALTSVPMPPKTSFWARLLGKKETASPMPCCDAFFAITAKRVLLFTSDETPREWFLMLGLIQDFKQKDNGYGDIIFENSINEAGLRMPIGLLHVADAQKVRDLLSSAIDAAYNASPWSV